MKKTGLVLAMATLLIVATVCATGSADAASGSESSFPSISEIFSTVQWPEYDFWADASTLFSAEVLGQIGSYLVDLGSFIINDTFLSDLGNLSMESFSGDEGYVNIFVLICLVIAIICILAAVGSYLANRKTFAKARKES